MSRDSLLEELRPAIGPGRVLDAVAAVDRARFVPRRLRGRAWDNVALPIGSDQTISQPLVVARMAALLDPGPDERVLDVGTGSGYHAAVLARLAAHVYGVERHPGLARGAARALAAAGIENVTVICGDGSLGLPAHAPFDAINVAAATPAHTLTRLSEQLAPGGRLVAPRKGADERLVRLSRTPAGVHQEAFEAVRFVPLVPGT